MATTLVVPAYPALPSLRYRSSLTSKGKARTGAKVKIITKAIGPATGLAWEFGACSAASSSSSTCSSPAPRSSSSSSRASLSTTWSSGSEATSSGTDAAPTLRHLAALDEYAGFNAQTVNGRRPVVNVTAHAMGTHDVDELVHMLNQPGVAALEVSFKATTTSANYGRQFLDALAVPHLVSLTLRPDRRWSTIAAIDDYLRSERSAGLQRLRIYAPWLGHQHLRALITAAEEGHAARTLTTLCLRGCWVYGEACVCDSIRRPSPNEVRRDPRFGPSAVELARIGPLVTRNRFYAAKVRRSALKMLVVSRILLDARPAPAFAPPTPRASSSPLVPTMSLAPPSSFGKKGKLRRMFSSGSLSKSITKSPSGLRKAIPLFGAPPAPEATTKAPLLPPILRLPTELRLRIAALAADEPALLSTDQASRVAKLAEDTGSLARIAGALQASVDKGMAVEAVRDEWLACGGFTYQL
ncbi:uncharacterized protein LOC62_04G005382 [Vanrija pseudolonga]|uniref:Uncharacterized protein n=1 Tax=Vanrija pseudolonga TaxID=143232 RepID=A0AAF1BI43_9TREE|nr:hypothetical protein LOC62_04G005382 [Vanrija pseudolonga]